MAADKPCPQLQPSLVLNIDLLLVPDRTDNRANLAVTALFLLVLVFPQKAIVRLQFIAYF